MRRTILLATAAVLVLLAAPAHAQADRDCDDFTSQGAAQSYFKGYGGSPANNVDNLDADHDGWACESYDYPDGGRADTPDTPDTTMGGGRKSATGGQLAHTGPGRTAPTGVALLAGGLVLVAGTRYRPRHAR